MTTLSLSTCQAPNFEGVCREVAAWLAKRLPIAIQFEDAASWQERYAALDACSLDICWICGLPYVRRADGRRPRIELLAAPVACGERYGGQPVYFSDVLVRVDSNAHSFADLRGCTWGLNEPNSWSGAGIVRYHLATLEHGLDYFGTVVETGVHQESIRRIVVGEIDAAAVDSTVLELELARDPQLASKCRVVHTLGPSPQPPWVIGTRVPAELRQAVRDALLNMHADPQGRLILRAGLMERFVPVKDLDYDVLREMVQVAGLYS